MNTQLIQKYLSNRRRRSIRHDIHSSFFYSPLSIDFTFGLRTANNVLNMKLNVTNFNLNPNDSDDVVKMIQARLRPFSIMIDFSQFSFRFLTQTFFIKKTRDDSFDSDDLKRTRFEKKTFHLPIRKNLLKKNPSNENLYRTLNRRKQDTRRIQNDRKKKTDSKNNEKQKKTRKRVYFVLFRTFVKSFSLSDFLFRPPTGKMSFEGTVLKFCLIGPYARCIWPFWAESINHIYNSHKKTPNKQSSSFTSTISFDITPQYEMPFIISHNFQVQVNTLC